MTTWPGGGSGSKLASEVEQDARDYTDAAVALGIAGVGASSGMLEQVRRSIITRPGSPGALLAAMKADNTPAVIYRMGTLDVGTTTATDESGNAEHGTYTGTVEKGLPTPLDAGDAQGVLFPGSASGYITTPALASLGTTITIEAWVRIRGNNSTQNIASHTGGGGSNLILRMLNSGAGFVLQLLNTNGQQVVASSVTLTDRYGWHHVVCTMAGSAASALLYLDGVDVTGSVTSQTINAHTTFRFGEGYTIMCMSHGAIYPSALSPAQVAARYAAARLDYRPAPFVLGVHSDLTYTGVGSADRTNKLADDAALGVRVARVSIPWYAIEAIEGVFTWTQTDTAIDALRAKGIEVIGVLTSSPQWANGSADPWVVPTGGSVADWVTKQAAWAPVPVTRYRDKINRWEIWNEPNEPYLWKSTPSATDYKTLYDAVRAAILAADPAARVAVGGLVGLTASSGIVGDTFLRSLCGAGIVMDYLSIHPYSGDPLTHDNSSTSYEDVLLIAETLWTLGYGETDLWITEFGWGTDTVSQAQQAQYLDDALRFMRDYMSRFVSVVTYFIDMDIGATYTQGLYTDATPKTAAGIFRKYAKRAA